jgi:hypothetical protein
VNNYWGILTEEDGVGFRRISPEIVFSIQFNPRKLASA